MGKIEKVYSNRISNYSMPNNSIEITTTKVSLPHDSKILRRRCIDQTVLVDAIPLVNRQYCGCRIQERGRRRDICILHRYPQTSWYPYQYHYFSKMYGQIIDRGNNLVHGTIGMTSWCNNGIGGIGLIFSYSSAWNVASSSGSEICLARILLKSHTIFTNRLNASSLYSVLTVSSTRCGSML